MVLTLVLVILVIFVFLKNVWATVIPSLALPFSIIGTFSVMYLLGYSLDNLSMMALILSVGFVVDDAIVMLENIYRHIEMGKDPLTASLVGSREIGFTIVSMTLSLAAVFIPMLFMGDVLGRLFREFSVTICVAILISGVVSVTLTPMLCSRFLRRPHHVEGGHHEGRFGARRGGRVPVAPEWIRSHAPDRPPAPRRHDDRVARDADAHGLLLRHRAERVHSGSGHRPDRRRRRRPRRAPPTTNWPSTRTRSPTSFGATRTCSGSSRPSAAAPRRRSVAPNLGQIVVHLKPRSERKRVPRTRSSKTSGRRLPQCQAFWCTCRIHRRFVSAGW